MLYNFVSWYDTFNGLLWHQVLDLWDNGHIPVNHKDINKPCVWRTSVITKKMDTFFRQEFKEEKKLKNIKQNYKPFIGKPLEIMKNKHKDILYAENLGKDSIMVIPTVRKGKNFSNLFFFMKNADLVQQKKIWKTVSQQVKIMLKKHDKLWINTHGFGISYLHIRIDSKPKYYEDSILKNIVDNSSIANEYCKYLNRKIKSKSKSKKNNSLNINNKSKKYK